MEEFFKSINYYYKEADYGSLMFWALPVCTILIVWLLVSFGVKILGRQKELKTIFIIHKALILSSLIVAAIIISTICYMWSDNIFANYHLELSLLISLVIAMLVSVASLYNLRSYYTTERIREIIEHPKTANQLKAVIANTKKAFTASKIYFLIPLIGFLFLFTYLSKGKNLITLVYDNSGSMNINDAITALEETFDKLEDNNEIVLATLNGPKYKPNTNAKTSISELMGVSRSENLFAGNVKSFNNPEEAKNAVSQITGFDCCSPICETIWKSFLFIKETRTNEVYRQKLLIVVTDGDDNYISESLNSGRFFFDDQKFADYFLPENIFIIDYSGGGSNIFMHRFSAAGCEIYQAENNKQSYLDAMDSVLQSYKNDWYLIYWVIIILSVFTIIAMLTQPKKII